MLQRKRVYVAHSLEAEKSRLGGGCICPSPGDSFLVKGLIMAV